MVSYWRRWKINSIRHWRSRNERRKEKGKVERRKREREREGGIRRTEKSIAYERERDERVMTERNRKSERDERGREREREREQGEGSHVEKPGWNKLFHIAPFILISQRPLSSESAAIHVSLWTFFFFNRQKFIFCLNEKHIHPDVRYH